MRQVNTAFHMLCFSENPLPWHMRALKWVLFAFLMTGEYIARLLRWFK